jgi:very-short-patch-repair endonuclease
MSLKYNRKLIPFAKELRRDATRQEKHLWYDFLSVYPVRFQRQKTIANYIADFYCSKAKLIIELDGSQHYTEEGIARDEKRTAALESLGLHVVRFSNLEINNNFDGVCKMIDRIVQAAK